MSRYDITTWSAITATDSGAVERALTRLEILFQRDPLVSMLTPTAYLGLASAIFSPLGLGRDSLPANLTPLTLSHVVRTVLDMSPLQILGSEFRLHIAGLVELAIYGAETDEATLRRVGHFPAPATV